MNDCANIPKVLNGTMSILTSWPGWNYSTGAVVRRRFFVCSKDKSAKVVLFAKLALQFGIKDQGELVEYLGAEVQASQESIGISQRQYSCDILKRFNFEQAHRVSNPLETNKTLVYASEKAKIDITFDYRGAVWLLVIWKRSLDLT